MEQTYCFFTKYADIRIIFNLRLGGCFAAARLNGFFLPDRTLFRGPPECFFPA